MDTKEIEIIIGDMNAEMKEMKKRYQERMQEVFKQAFLKYFEANPDVTCFSWRQYTPYFNDGDPCVFRCYVDYGSITNARDYRSVRWGEYDGEQEDVWIDDPDYGGFNEEAVPKQVLESTQSLRRLLGRVDDNVMLDMFGDHVVVYATRDGFEVDGYDHD